MLSDIEIAQATQPEHIRAIAEKAGVAEEHLELYGNYKAKVDYNLLVEEQHEPGMYLRSLSMDHRLCGTIPAMTFYSKSSLT